MLPLALALTLAAVAYFLTTTLIDLYPLNNVRDAKRSEQLTEIAANAPVMTLPAVLLGLAATLRLPVLGYLGGAIELFIAIGGVVLWWMPYLVGVTAPWATAGTGVTWSELHARTYAHTLTVLPPIGDRPRPNVEHMILHALILAAATCTLIAAATL
jgi:undecaprenyl pyrophosphate phosphatase UppP